MIRDVRFRTPGWGLSIKDNSLLFFKGHVEGVYIKLQGNEVEEGHYSNHLSQDIWAATFSATGYGVRERTPLENWKWLCAIRPELKLRELGLKFGLPHSVTRRDYAAI